MHRKLMQGARGEAFCTPGAFRTVQNHIGNTREHTDARFVPPPPDELHDCLDALFGYLAAAKPQTPALVEAAWLHYQFEAIHPFLDGNGRLGRLLVPLFLVDKKLLSSPNFYISAFLEANRDEYYQRLLAVSANNDWTGWCEFFLRAMIEQARSNQSKAKAIMDLYRNKKEWIAELTHSHHSVKALDWFFCRPIFKTPDFVTTSGIPRPTANRIVRLAREEGLLRILRPRMGRRPATLVFPELLNLAEGRPAF